MGGNLLKDLDVFLEQHFKYNRESEEEWSINNDHEEEGLKRWDPIERGELQFRYESFTNFDKFLRGKYLPEYADDLDGYLGKYNEITLLKNTALRWLYHLHTAREQSVHMEEHKEDNFEHPYYGDFLFLRKILGEGWEQTTQSIINTICTFAPKEWFEEIKKDQDISIYQDTQKSPQDCTSCIFYSEATPKDIQTTLEFAEKVKIRDY